MGRHARWTEEEIIQCLQDHARIHGYAPRCTDWNRATPERPYFSTVARAFGSWSQGIKAAGLARRVRPGREGKSYVGPRGDRWWTSERIISVLRQCALLMKRAPSYAEFERASLGRPGGDWPSASMVRIRFNCWNEALAAAGLPVNSSKSGWTRPRRWTQEAIITAMHRWAAKRGQLPVCSDWAIARPGIHPSAATVYLRFGLWSAAIEAARNKIAA